MAWGNVSWATQDVISLTKMTQINDNIDMAKDEVEYKVLFSGNVTDTATAEQSDIVDFKIDGTVIINGAQGTTELMNHYVGGLDEELHEFRFGLDNGSPEYCFKWYKTPDINYVSIWFTSFADEHSGEAYLYGCKEVTIFGHRSTETW